jgi:hypothetical protein
MKPPVVTATNPMPKDSESRRPIPVRIEHATGIEEVEVRVISNFHDALRSADASFG